MYQQIGKLQMELDWLKKKLPPSIELKRSRIDPEHRQLSIRQQCELVNLNRSSFYWAPAVESAANLAMMR